MSAISPWSQAVVENLTMRGFRVQVANYTYSTDAYLSIDDEPVAHSVAALRSVADRVHIVETSASLIGRVAAGAYHLRRIMRDFRPDAVLTLYGGTNAAIAWTSGIRPYIVYVVGSDVLLASGIRRIVSRLALNNAAAVLANGRHLAVSANQLAPRAAVTPLYLGTDLTYFQPPPHRPLAPRFVCTRGFGHLYDNATIVRAVASLTRVPADFEMRFVSTGPELQRSVALADELMPASRRAGVEFMGGVSDSGLLAALHRASFYVSASLSDGASASLLEAMACGLFPIVSDIPANREWLVHGDNGLLFSPGNHMELARCIERALNDIPWLATAVRKNRELVAERAELGSSMTALADILRQHVLSRPRSGAG